MGGGGGVVDLELPKGDSEGAERAMVFSSDGGGDRVGDRAS